MLSDMLGLAEPAADRRLNALRQALEARASTEVAQELFRSAFPDGLKFLQIEVGKRKVWRIQGTGVLTGSLWIATPPPKKKPRRLSNWLRNRACSL